MDAVPECICPKEPKIPRPRNTFILFRQHHQARVVRDNPGVTNPDISKLIGKLWRSLGPDDQAKWKKLADEEKARHRRQYPNYRFQPRRNTKGSITLTESAGPSGEKQTCLKCGGRTPIGSSSSHISVADSTSSTALTSSLPTRGQSTRAPFMDRNIMSQPLDKLRTNESESAPLPLDQKRRRLDSNPPMMTYNMPARHHNAPTSPMIQPSGPFPQQQSPLQRIQVSEACAPVIQTNGWFSHMQPPLQRLQVFEGAQREGQISPGPRSGLETNITPHAMAPPPRPVTEYPDHHMMPGPPMHDRAQLTLPPLQMNKPMQPAVDPENLPRDFRYKLSILRQVAPPMFISETRPRGPLIAVEGDDPQAVRGVASWLQETLNVEDDLMVKLIEGPRLVTGGNRRAMMAQYHHLAAEWLERSDQIFESLLVQPLPPTFPPNNSENRNSMTKAEKGENSYTMDAKGDRGRLSFVADIPVARRHPQNSQSSTLVKPVIIIGNFSLHATNFFAQHIQLPVTDPYKLNDHWQWTATQWRGIVSPDLTIYVRDATPMDAMKPSLDISDDNAVFVVKRASNRDGKMEVEPSLLRRLRFEVSEWIRAFGMRTG